MVLSKKDGLSSPVAKFENLSKEKFEQEYTQNLANGKKNLLCGDFPEAVCCFQNASYLRSEQFGDTSHECAEAFFYYGKALLELARIENTVLGNALKGVPDTEESECENDDQFEVTKNIPDKEREELRDLVVDALAPEEEESTDDQEVSDDTKTADEGKSASEETSKQEAEQSSDEKAEEKQSTETKEKSDEKAEEKPNTDDTKTAVEENGDTKPTPKQEETEQTTDEKDVEKQSTAKAEPSDNDTKPSENEPKKDETEAATDEPSCDEPSTSSGVTAPSKKNSSEDVSQEDPDDIPNMQLAWEMLEMAKVLYAKKPESESNSLLIAQCHSKLGELGLEVEDYPQSIGDFQTCLDIYEKYLPYHDRRLAETRYNLGLANFFTKDYDLSLKHYRHASDILEKRMQFLDEQMDAKGDTDDSEVKEECAEIGEIKNLIPDIYAKIEDAILLKNQEQRSSEMGECSSSGLPGASSTPIPLQTKKPTEQGASSSSAMEVTSDISHLVRRKRPIVESEQQNTTDAAQVSDSVPASKKLKEEKVSELKSAPVAKEMDENEKENVNIAAETA